MSNDCSIVENIKNIKIHGGRLPPRPGVYLMKDARGAVIYVGKAASLKTRVSSYFNRPHEARISRMASEIRSIDYRLTPSALEALILEAKLIKQLHPKYNIREQDDKSFLYVVFTADQYPKVLLVRGNELGKYQISNDKFQTSSNIQHANSKPHIFGPFTSASALRAALQIVRRIFHWSNCKPGAAGARSCFYYHLGQCPGICIGAISPAQYRRQVIRPMILFFDGKKAQVMKDVEARMKQAAKKEKFEEAESLKRQLFSLRHIRDTAILTAESIGQSARSTKQKHTPFALRTRPIDIFGRIEAYDISNISGTSAVGSMVVFQGGEPEKSEYRKFKIKNVSGINDVAMMREMLGRRFKRIQDYGLRIKQGDWPMPDLLVIDGGVGQVRAAIEVLEELKLKIPVIGIAKGFNRKQDRPVYGRGNPELDRIVENHKDLILRARDEAHRFAVAYHRKRRSADFLGGK